MRVRWLLIAFFFALNTMIAAANGKWGGAFVCAGLLLLFLALGIWDSYRPPANFEKSRNVSDETTAIVEDECVSRLETAVEEHLLVDHCLDCLSTARDRYYRDSPLHSERGLDLAGAVDRYLASDPRDRAEEDLLAALFRAYGDDVKSIQKWLPVKPSNSPTFKS